MTSKSPPQRISNEKFRIMVSEQTSAALEAIEAEQGLTERQAAEFFASVGDVLAENLPLTELSPLIERTLPIKKEQADKLAVCALLAVFYPYWPLFPDIDTAIKELGGEVPNERPAMPKIEGDTNNEPISYPKLKTTSTDEEPELLGGLEIPVPPAPRTARDLEPTTIDKQGFFERDVAWQPPQKELRSQFSDYSDAINGPSSDARNESGVNIEAVSQKNVAKPNDVAKLLEKNLLKKEE